ncbi:uncharacterized protein LOC124700742 [Lolium rigidum]|uniref:uncharacterized protein LOC124700725 n=1 Tax=Lolium rigidum TaxID=89674 RepID=UPI001F5CEBE1|nr:uncharacterized protein LOC124700725 [Lolium rigidum]XP_047088777.1 uncharacterized protein LOC124700742 [Lolium rigidum]
MRLQQGHHGELSSRLPDDDLENMFSSLTTDDILSQGASGECREDKKRRLHEGNTRDLTSRHADEDLEYIFSSLTIDSILSQGTSGDFCKNRKRKSCQEPAGYLINRSPDDILDNLFSALAIQDATFASSASRRTGEQSTVLVFGYNTFSEESSGCTTSIECNHPADSRSLRSDEFIDRVNDQLLRHDGTGVHVFEVHFDLNSTHASHLDKWVQFALKSDAQCVKLHLCKNATPCSMHSVTESRYNFPLHCFGDGQASSLRKLSLTNCILGPSMHSISFSSLVSLYLTCVTVTDSDIQNIFSCCHVLRSLRLGRCHDLVNIRISIETLLHLDIYQCKKLVSIEINSTSLLFFEYAGHEVRIKYASTPNMRTIVTKFWNRNCSLSEHLNDIKMIRKVTLTFLSPCEEHSFILYTKKFALLKFVNLLILPSWDNVLAVAYLLEATPYLRRLRLEARSGQHHYVENGQVSLPVDFYLKKLRGIFVGGFAAQAPLIELLACLVRAAPGLLLLKIDPHHHLCKAMGKWARDDVGDEAARDHARNAARETIGPKLPPSVKLIIE